MVKDYYSSNLSSNVFEISEPEPVFDDIGVEKYTLLCKEFKIVPISRVIKSLPGDIMNLKVEI